MRTRGSISSLSLNHTTSICDDQSSWIINYFFLFPCLVLGLHGLCFVDFPYSIVLCFMFTIFWPIKTDQMLGIQYCICFLSIWTQNIISCKLFLENDLISHTQPWRSTLIFTNELGHPEKSLHSHFTGGCREKISHGGHAMKHCKTSSE